MPFSTFLNIWTELSMVTPMCFTDSITRPHSRSLNSPPRSIVLWLYTYFFWKKDKTRKFLPSQLSSVSWNLPAFPATALGRFILQICIINTIILHTARRHFSCCGHLESLTVRPLKAGDLNFLLGRECTTLWNQTVRTHWFFASFKYLVYFSSPHVKKKKKGKDSCLIVFTFKDIKMWGSVPTASQHKTSRNRSQLNTSSQVCLPLHFTPRQTFTKASCWAPGSMSKGTAY